MKVLLLALGLSAVGGVLLAASCGNAPATGDSCLVDEASFGGCKNGNGAGSFTECGVDGDCPQPPDGRCGEGRCVEGKCEIDIRQGPIPSQLYGDCQQVICDWDGNVVSQSDSSDAYDDGRECTIDLCEGGKPENIFLHEGTPCPASEKGVCYEGECVQCTWSMDNLCGGSGMVCTYIWCTPLQQCAEMFCGGPCAPCSSGHSCKVNEDCLDRKCAGGKCQAPTCDDSIKNGDEEDVDCGGPTCGPCAAGQGCLSPADCQSDVCIAGKCQAPTCFDGTKNGTETGPDCGGPCGPC
jgi:hypothetical protein